MTPQEYITTYAPKLAQPETDRNANKLCKEIQTLCECSTQEAVKTLIATFDEALKIRDKQTAITPKTKSDENNNPKNHRREQCNVQP